MNFAPEALIQVYTQCVYPQDPRISQTDLGSLDPLQRSHGAASVCLLLRRSLRVCNPSLGSGPRGPPKNSLEATLKQLQEVMNLSTQESGKAILL